MANALLFLSCLAALHAVGAYNENPYQPSSQVREFHKFQFEISDSYLNKLLWNSLPLIIIGLFFFIFFICWSCGRCCCKCFRASDEATTSRPLLIFYTVALVLVALAGIALLAYGLDADAKQNKALNDIPPLVASILNWISQLIFDAQQVLSSAQLVIEAGNSVLDTPQLCQEVDCTSVRNIVNQSQVTIANIQKILDDLSSSEIANINRKTRDYVNQGNDARHIVMLAILVPMFIAIVLQTLLTLANAFLNVGHQPRSMCLCRPIEWLTTATVILFLVVMWAFAAVLLTVSVGSADFCIAPEANIVSVGNVNNDIALYYINCGNNPSMVNPLHQYTNQIVEACNQSLVLLAQFNASVQSNCPQEADCQSAVANVSSAIFQTLSAIGLTQSGDYTNSGVLSLISCRNCNGLLQGALNVLCGSVFESVALTCKVFLAFACLLILLELFRRMMPVKRESEHQLYQPLMDIKTQDPSSQSSYQYSNIPHAGFIAGTPAPYTSPNNSPYSNAAQLSPSKDSSHPPPYATYGDGKSSLA